VRRDELAELLRTASILTEDGDILVVGSQSILGTFDESRLPERATLSQEADIVFLRDVDRRKADLVNAYIGEMSPHQQRTGVYAEGLHKETLVLPTGWRRRTITWHREPSTPSFLERHDLCASKLARGAAKDLDFVGALVDAGLIDLPTLIARTTSLQTDPAHVAAALARARAFDRR
jgi:hypothetical protein